MALTENAATKCLTSTVANASKLETPERLEPVANIDIFKIKYGFHGKNNKRTCYIVQGGIHSKPVFCKDQSALLEKLAEQPKEKFKILHGDNFPQIMIAVLIFAILGFAIYFVSMLTTETNSGTIFQNILNAFAGLIGIFIGLIGGKKL